MLVARERLRDLAVALNGHGWRPRYASAKRSWRDVTRGVDVDVITSCDFPGDGLPKAVSYPVPDADVTVRTPLEGVPVLDLVQLVQLKLASAASAPHRAKDAADVRALIVANELPWAFAAELDVSCSCSSGRRARRRGTRVSCERVSPWLAAHHICVLYRAAGQVQARASVSSIHIKFTLTR